MEKKLELLKETILLGESLITEAKKIGIDKLPYGYDSLTRFIDVKTMNVHYNKHYKGYVKKLNDALSKKNYGNVELEDIIKSITRYPKVIRNNGGGAYNHSLFWKMLSPDKQTIKGEILTKINKEFGSYKEFKKKFEEESIGRFGSGWAWLVLTKNNRLKIMTTPNQDNPQMNDIDGGYPLLGLDLWEHAYYLKYQSKRDEYIKRFWDVVNWEFVNDVYLSKLKTKLKESIKSNKVITEEGSYKNFKYNPVKDFGKVTEFIKENGRINPKVFDVMLPKVYPKCSPEIINDYNKDTHITEPCFGKIKTNDCETNYGVIGGKYAVSQRGGIGEWSVINWFDANTKVSDKILEYFEKYNKEGLDFISWFFKLKKTLLSDDGMFTSELADFIMNPQTKKGTLDYGSSRESLALEILNKEYGNSNITRFCDGDVRDKYKGQDMKLTREDISEYIQVKPTRDLYETNIDGQVKYVFKSKNKYTPNNINIFAFIDNIKNYVFFDFKNVEVKDDGGQSKERYSYIFKSENIKFKSDRLYLSKINLTESITKRELLNEAKSDFPNFRTMRSIIQSVYNKCDSNNPIEGWVNGCKGDLNIPECGPTNIGIIGGDYTEERYGGKGNWSLVNRWDANSNVHSEIEKIYKEEAEKFKTENKIKKYSISLRQWIDDNRVDLFSNDGKWIDRLAKVSIENFEQGLKNEEYGRDMINLAFGLDKYKQDIEYKINFNCGGSKADTIKGQDIVLKFENEEPIHFQIKSIKEGYVKLFNSDRGKYYRVASWHEHTKYKEENVDLIVYVNQENKEYIIFDNDFSKIITTPNSNYKRNNLEGDVNIPKYIYYYEEPFKTNMTNIELMTPQLKGKTNPRLEKDKDQLIKLYQERMSYYKNKLKELGINDENISEAIRFYKNKINKLLYS
jgi:Fe-Mn family superoxide dismutase